MQDAAVYLVKSLVLTLDPHTQGGVIAMQQAMLRAHLRLGLEPWLGYARAGRRERIALWPREGTFADRKTISFGYVPSIEYLNYAVPALLMRRRLAEFPLLQLVSGSHAASLLPIAARRPFVSWVATPFGDEIRSRRRDPRPTLSVRINDRLRFLNDAIERFTYRHPSKIFALSSYTARRLAEATRLPASTFDVLRMPVDLAAFHPQGARWPRVSGRYVVSVSRVDDERKNVASLVRCFAKIAPRHPDVSLVVAGQVEPESRVVRLASELGIGARVLFPGILRGAELAALYRSAEAYVMTSRQEGLGIVVLEAQASGCAPLVMRCGGSDELIEEGRTGWLVDQANEEAFSARLDEVLRDGELRARVGRAARASVERTSSTEAFDAALRAAYAPLLGTVPGRSNGAIVDRPRTTPSA